MAAQNDENKRSPLKAWVRALERTAAIERNPELTLPVAIGRLADRFGDRPALTSRKGTLNYRELGAAIDACSVWALQQGLTAGDTVSLFMENCPEYLSIWLGLARVGVSVALINTNLAGEPLVHSIGTVAPRFVIASALLAPRIAPIRDRLAPGTQFRVAGPALERMPSLTAELAATAGAAPADFRAPTLRDRALCIYTSGTTGLPKAANVSHYRLMQWSYWFCGLMDVKPEDRMYNCLPLYHSVGGVVATGAVLVAGGTVVLRERFSASTFWQDVGAERCTLFQYIGELCRYLLAAPEQPDETRHALRLACGNGLRGDVWVPFQARFRVPQILEYYAATEGNFSLYNCEGQPGAIGRIPPFLVHRLPVALVRFDVETSLPLRDEAGRCVRCAPGEVGEAIGQIQGDAGASRFEGYTDAGASAKKVLRDVFAPGDRWYRTGDLMRQDAQGFFYFVDRVGDTFRWKGENVSTTEVAAVIGACPGVHDVAVYGVAVPGADGRAGMAALVTGPEFDLGQLSAVLSAQLPAYARPVFIRILRHLEVTGTFKLRKQELIEEGYDPGRIADRLYVRDGAAEGYVPLDASLAKRLTEGRFRA
ncbi:MAG: long-chain-acyl-CoA synthetase [Proteobacteria bacterium]|nr:long-chain-acyl-CoA synthetase [Pseudomonadota bacterium]